MNQTAAAAASPCAPPEEPRNLRDIIWVVVVLAVVMAILVCMIARALYFHFTNSGTENRRKKLKVYALTWLVVTAMVITFFDSYVAQYEPNTHGSKKLVASFDLVASFFAAAVYVAQFIGSRDLENAIAGFCGVAGFGFRVILFAWVVSGADQVPENSKSVVVVTFSGLAWLVAGAGAFIPALGDAYNLAD